MQNQTASYPERYHRTLLALQPDGTPLIVRLPSADDAQKERLRFYNFLKWCRRPVNVNSVVHLAGRYNQVTLKVVENEIHFALKTNERWHRTDDAFDAAFEEAGLTSALPVVPPSANPRIFAQLPKGEAQPLMPDWEQPAPSGFGQFMMAGMSEADRIALEESNKKLVELSASIQEHGISVETPEVHWFPAKLRKALGDGIIENNGPQVRLQTVMNKLIFEMPSCDISYPVMKDNKHEISWNAVDALTKIWSNFFVEHMGMYIVLERLEVAWRFSLTEEAEELLDANKLGLHNRTAIFNEEVKNRVRQDVLKLFNPQGA